jgi:hypothetical protein
MYKFNLKIIVLLLSLVVLNTLLIQKIKAGEYIIRPGSFSITFHGDVTQEKVDYLEKKYKKYKLKYKMSWLEKRDGKINTIHETGREFTYSEKLVKNPEELRLMIKAEEIVRFVNYCGTLTVSQSNEKYYNEPQTRHIPNDPGFGAQWSFHNTGQRVGFSGFNKRGKVGADISATKAWDVVKSVSGNVNPATKVIAIIDIGFNNQPDLMYNRLEHIDERQPDWPYTTFDGRYWMNYTSGYDGNNNGFANDHFGWNAYAQREGKI